jgi:type II secretory pathway pseudopilin PulG
MKNRKAFTLVEIIIGAVLVTVVLGVCYRVISGTIEQMFKSSNKMTNLRAASIILERIKNDMRCAVVPVKEEEEFKNENGVISFYSTNDSSGNRNHVKYTYDKESGSLKRYCNSNDKERTISSAKVSSFSVDIGENNRFLTVRIVVDNERDNQFRSINSKNNEIELEAVLYPRFLTETLTDEERYWHKTTQLGNNDGNDD